MEESDVRPLSFTEKLMSNVAAGSASFEIECGVGAVRNLAFASFSSVFSGMRNRKRYSGCFAKIGSVQYGTSPAAKKVEHYSVRKVAGDGRCLFRALALGIAVNRGVSLSSFEEQHDADKLRLGVRDAICRSEHHRKLYEEALIAITIDESLKRYCQRISSSSFWGGESELLVISRMSCQPIIVYIPENEAIRGRWGIGFIPIAEYGMEFTKSSKERKASKPIRLLYSGGNHYDLLL